MVSRLGLPYTRAANPSRVCVFGSIPTALAPRLGPLQPPQDWARPLHGNGARAMAHKSTDQEKPPRSPRPSLEWRPPWTNRDDLTHIEQWPPLRHADGCAQAQKPGI